MAVLKYNSGKPWISDEQNISANISVHIKDIHRKMPTDLLKFSLTMLLIQSCFENYNVSYIAVVCFCCV